ncbi:MAG: hypothetical protein IPM91_08685 [Bacteroidetes bacterium]|nr:hypothetical protein [Bacteroidota bacterium]
MGRRGIQPLLKENKYIGEVAHFSCGIVMNPSPLATRDMFMIALIVLQTSLFTITMDQFIPNRKRTLLPTDQFHPIVNSI